MMVKKISILVGVCLLLGNIAQANAQLSPSEELRLQAQRLQQTVDKTARAGVPTGNIGGQTPAQASPEAQIPPEAAVEPTTPISPATTPTPSPQTGAEGAQGQNQQAGATTVTQGQLRRQAFTDVTNSLFPMTNQQVEVLHQLFDRVQRAAGNYPGVPPRPTSSSVNVNLSPGATPPVVRLGNGFVTSIVFLDSTGAPWPIKAFDLGNPRDINIQWDKKGNTLLVQALSTSRTANLAVLLHGLDTPVMVTLLPGQRAIDYRVDMRIPGLGPHAQMEEADGVPMTDDSLLLNTLNGITPLHGRQVKLQGCNQCQAWMVNRKLYLRTPMTMLSPGWISTLSSADGTHAYELQPTPVILLSRHGKMVKINVQGY